MLRCCYRQYRWTGDRAYLEDPAFLNFYRRTVDDYVKRWDKDGDGVPESYREYGHRGIGSYDEDLEFHVLVGADLVAAQSAAYGAYAAIADLLGERDTAGRYRALEQKLRAWFNESWWDAGHRSFYRALKQDRTFLSRPDEAVPAIWFDIVDPGAKTAAALDALSARNVEVRSYYPEIAYRYERCETGYARLMELTDPALLRREYPEVSYAVLGAIAEGLMGVDPDARSPHRRHLSPPDSRQNRLGEAESSARVRRRNRSPPYGSNAIRIPQSHHGAFAMARQFPRCARAPARRRQTPPRFSGHPSRRQR